MRTSFLYIVLSCAVVASAGATGRQRFLAEDDVDTSVSLCGTDAFADFVREALGPAKAPDSLMSQIPIDYKYLDVFPVALLAVYSFLSTGQSQPRIGFNGTSTAEISQQHELLLDFWDVPSQQTITGTIRLIGLSGRDLQENMEPAVAKLLADLQDREDYVLDVADQIRTAIVTELPGGYDNPALSLQNMAIPGSRLQRGSNDFYIAIGDGLLQFADSLGFGDVGADWEHAQSFSRIMLTHVAMANLASFGIEGVPSFRQTLSAEQEQTLQLEIDAMAAYSLAHKQGKALPEEDILQVVRWVGDSGSRLEAAEVESPGQRECAVRWAADEAMSSGEKLSVKEFRDVFLVNLEGIQNLDPVTCQFEKLGDLKSVKCGSIEKESSSTSKKLEWWHIVLAFVGSLLVGSILFGICKKCIKKASGYTQTNLEPGETIGTV